MSWRHSPAPTLQTERLILRAHRPGDLDECAALWADPAVVRHISGEPSSRQASWTRLLRHAGHWALMGFGYWAVEARADGRFVGEVGFATYEREIGKALDGVPEAGWVLKQAEWGKGYASEAVSRMIGWADREARFEKTACIFDPAHLASIAVARKAGYREAETATYRGQPTSIWVREAGL